MSILKIKIPDSLHEDAKELAKKDHVSVNQLIATALAEKLSALMTEEYLEERAKRGDRKKFKDSLSRVPDTEPEEWDKF